MRVLQRIANLTTGAKGKIEVLIKTGAVKTHTPRNGGKENRQKMAVGELICVF
jgi:hypothetical protein